MADRQAFEEEPFEGEFPFEEDFEVFGPDEDLEALFESEGGSGSARVRGGGGGTLRCQGAPRGPPEPALGP